MAAPLELIRQLASQVQHLNPNLLSRPQQQDWSRLARTVYTPRVMEAQHKYEQWMEMAEKASSEEQRTKFLAAAMKAEYDAARFSKLDQAAVNIAKAKGKWTNDEDLRAMYLPGKEQGIPGGIATYYPPGHSPSDPLLEDATYLELLGASPDAQGAGRVLLRQTGMTSPSNPMVWHSVFNPKTLGFYESRGAQQIPKSELPKESVMYGNLPVFQVPRGDAIKEKHGGPVKMASGGALQKVMQEVLGKYRVKGRNALLLPPARDLGGNFNFDRALAQSLQEAAGSKVNLETGSSVAPLWLHGQRAASGLGSIPSNLRNATKKQGPLYFTDNPLIATTAEYATDSPQFDDAQRFLWPYLLADGAVPTVQKSKGEWRSGLDRLDEQLEGFGQGTMDWTTMLYALKEANRLDPGSVPDNLIFKGIMDVGPGTKGTGFEMSKQNQMMLRTPRSLVENGGLLPIFDDAQPWKHGGLVQYARSRA